MRNATYIGRVGALAVALGVGLAVANTPAVAHAEPSDSSSCSSDSSEPDSTALIMGGGTVSTPDDSRRTYVRVSARISLRPIRPARGESGLHLESQSTAEI